MSKPVLAIVFLVTLSAVAACTYFLTESERVSSNDILKALISLLVVLAGIIALACFAANGVN